MNLSNVCVASGKLLAIALIAFELTACGGGGDETSVPVTLTGSVGDGPIVGATITVHSINGRVLSTQVSDANANYSVSFNANIKKFPVIVEASGGTDLVTGQRPDFTLASIALDATSQRVNINPFSTLIVRTAQDMPGGINSKNLELARQVVMTRLSFGLDTDEIPDPISVEITEANIGKIVKASEVMGEMVRRARDTLVSAGHTLEGDDIINALAADLSDGSMDGVGHAWSDPRISAAVTLASAQVMIEALSNSLYVGGALATYNLDNAIRISKPSASASSMTRNVQITQGAINQTHLAVDAAKAVAPSMALTSISSILETLRPNSLPESIAAVLPSDTSSDLNPALTLIAVADGAQIEAVNAVTRDGLVIEVNRAPVLTGTAPSSATVGSIYSFSPSATDADGDGLTFSVVNLPQWANFNTATGNLSGTPGASDVGTYSGITIKATDGTDSASMSFDVTVSSHEPANSVPQLSGSPAPQAVVGAAYSFRPTALDADNDPLIFSIVNRPQWASFNTSTGVLSGTPSSTDVGIYSGITIRVSDGMETASISFNLSVVAAVESNNAPSISGAPSTQVNEDAAYSFVPSASDPDGNNLSFGITNRPIWASFNTRTGALTGTPTQEHVGTTSNIVIRVSDGSLTTSLPAFSITVVNTNDAPTISGTPMTSVTAGSPYSFQPIAMDVDGDNLSFSIANRPPWATFNTSTGRLSGVPGREHVGTTSNIVISVSDGTTTRSLPGFGITVNANQVVGTARVSWDAPVARENGDALSMQQINGYKVYYGSQQGNYPNSVTINDAYTTEVTIGNLASGTYYFVVTVVDTQGNESEYSNVGSKVIY